MVVLHHLECSYCEGLVFADVHGCKRGLIRESEADRWQGKDNKTLAGRRLLRGFLLNYVMGHVRALIAGL